MTLEEARKVFEQYDGILLEMWQKDHDAYSRFQDAYIFSEITEQWRRELIEKAYNEGRPLSRILAMIREAKEDQEDYADRFLAEFRSYEPDEEERKLLADELVNESPTCGYNWLRQFVRDLTELQRCTEKLISSGDEKLQETFETLEK
jgi:hypothetical protein